MSDARDNTGSKRAARLVLIFLGAEEQLEQLARQVQLLPPSLRERAAEITLLLAGPGSSEALPAAVEALRQGTANLRVHRDSHGTGHGGRRKVAFEYAIEHGFDHLAVIEPDRRFAPAALEALWSAALDGADLVLGVSRGSVVQRVLHNGLLGMDVADYAAPMRLVSTEFLRRVPFHLNEDGRGFDTQLLIQARALGATVRSIAVDVEPDDEFPALHSLALACGYRAHQLHLTRRGEYFVDRDVHYTLKRHPSGSHMQVLEAIRPGTLVLDLGCSQGLLAGPLAAKGVRVVGVDVGPRERVASEMAAYYQRDLEAPLEIPEGRVFDYVVCSDVIEHIVHRAELLRSVRRYLKPDGRLLISTPNIAIWFYRLSLLAGRFEYGPRGVLDETHVHLFTRSTFRREVESAAFRVLRERVTALPFEVVFESTGRSSVVRALASAYHALARLWPALFAYQFLLEAEVGTLLDKPAKTR
jgi:2-polyprenyl-3-methyl-5-hydroxy-6-metoxy-1,4-benzoquinol methylase